MSQYRYSSEDCSLFAASARTIQLNLKPLLGAYISPLRHNPVPLLIMSSPGPTEPAPPRESWSMDASRNESTTAHLTDVSENPVHHENGDAGNDPNQSGDILLQPSTTAGGPDLGVPGAQTGTIYREKQIKVQNISLSCSPCLSLPLVSRLGLMRFSMVA